MATATLVRAIVFDELADPGRASGRGRPPGRPSTRRATASSGPGRRWDAREARPGIGHLHVAPIVVRQIVDIISLIGQRKEIDRAELVRKVLEKRLTQAAAASRWASASGR
jgi:hypothetical protein